MIEEPLACIGKEWCGICMACGWAQKQDDQTIPAIELVKIPSKPQKPQV